MASGEPFTKQYHWLWVLEEPLLLPLPLPLEEEAEEDKELLSLS